ncbi:MAG TPA: hypothetical protein VKK79_07400 [Candidatus Lokiarchaeia archaeon]|nr:hypothetical protein [Candidatus Lokiarchaeia archaeon]
MQLSKMVNANNLAEARQRVENLFEMTCKDLFSNCRGCPHILYHSFQKWIGLQQWMGGENDV